MGLLYPTKVYPQVTTSV